MTLGPGPAPGPCHGKGGWPEELAQLSSQGLKPSCLGAQVTEWLAEWRWHAFLPYPDPMRTPGHHGVCIMSTGQGAQRPGCGYHSQWNLGESRCLVVMADLFKQHQDGLLENLHETFLADF